MAPRTFLIALVFIFFNFPIYGETAGEGISKGRVGLGINYPGVSLRYFLKDRYSIEGKGQFGQGVSVIGARFYRYFKPAVGILPLAGFEADLIQFEGEESEGSGFAGAVFVGGEYFLSKRISLQLDFGPAFISLADEETSETISGIEYVINFGINYYFGGEKPRRGKNRQ